MNQLLIITVGPVQPLIAAARKSRDLFLGSDLLSEISREIAWTLHKAGAQLIFPNPKEPDEVLKPPEELGLAGRFNVANRIVALVEGDDAAVKALAEEGMSRAGQFLTSEGEKLIPKAGAKMSRHKYLRDVPVRAEAFHAQLEDALELSSVWVPIPEVAPANSTPYAEALKQANARMSARKRLKDFSSGESKQGYQKSALDGRADSILERVNRERDGRKMVPVSGDVQKRRRAGLKPGETLDALGLIKRAAGKPERFLPLSRLALDPWIQGNLKDADFAAALAQFTETIIEGMSKQALEGYVSWIGHKGTLKGRPHFDPFPFDGELLFEGQLRAQIKQAAREKHTKAESFLKEHLLPQQEAIHRRWGIPNPYVCFLLADGDNMGNTLRKLKDHEQHQSLSQTLAGFTQEAREIVEGENTGSLLYSGGDDILAALSVDKALPCAKALHDTFGTQMKAWLKGMGVDITPPTLSMGIVIGHALAPMGDLLKLTRAMEKKAKNGPRERCTPNRDGFAIAYTPRSGADVTFYQRWVPAVAAPAPGAGDVWPGDLYKKDPVQLLETLRAWLDDESIPHRSAFHLLGLRRELASIYAGKDPMPVLAMTAEAARVLGRKRGGRGAHLVEDDVHGALVGYLTWAVAEESAISPPPAKGAEAGPGEARPEAVLGALDRLVNGLLIARQLVTADRQRQGKTNQGEVNHE